MHYNKNDIDEVIEYYINQVFKILHLFEEGNREGYKHVRKVKLELEKLPNISLSIKKSLILRMEVKLDLLYDAMLDIDQVEHQYVKNLMFECRNLLLEIKEGVRHGDA
jgi:hypothetical protein